MRHKLIIPFLILVLMLSGCRSKQVATDKKETTISELQQNGIEKTEQLHKDVSHIRIERKDHFSIVPIDEQKTAKVIYQGDTLSLDNARIDVGSERNEITKDDRSVATATTKDKSRRELKVDTEEKLKTKDITSASWGLNIGIVVGIVILALMGYLHFQKP